MVTTHQVEEVQHILTDLAFIRSGRIVLSCSMEAFEQRYLEVMVAPENLAAARAWAPINERQVFGRSILLFDSAPREQLATLGGGSTPPASPTCSSPSWAAHPPKHEAAA